MTPTELSTNPAESKETGSTSNRSRRRIVLASFLVSFVIGSAAFFALDYSYSATILRPSLPIRAIKTCQVPDSVRHHAFQPNCASIEYWGGDSYKFFSNSLGFRDKEIRQVPLADARPRILILGDSYVEGKLAWRNSIVGRIADHFPQHDFLNGGEDGYSPSNFLNTTRMVLAKGVHIDEVIVFIDNSAVQAEAAFYRDADPSGAVTGIAREQQRSAESWYVRLRGFVVKHLALTSGVLRPVERLQPFLVRHGYYHLPANVFGNLFDREMSAWTYRKVNETDPFPAGYAPLGVEGGIAKEMAKMTLLWQELEKQNIPISVVVYPHPAQIVHDTADSRQVQIFREWCKGKCKRFISLFPAFLAEKDQCPPIQPGCWYQTLFVFGDNHFNAAGNALVADAVINSLAEEPPAKRPESGAGMSAH